MNGRPYAEVIGDPIAQSKSPLIHNFWLGKLGIDAEYRACHVRPDELAEYFARRRGDTEWRGCNVTMPHKQQIMGQMEEVDARVEAIGAANTVIRVSDHLFAANTDVEGIAGALDGWVRPQTRVTLIGAGGAARAALFFLKRPDVSRVAVVARDPGRAEDLRQISTPKDHLKLEFYSFDAVPSAMSGSNVVINASPLGMTGTLPMPPAVWEGLSHAASDASVFDMVYQPLETRLLAAAKDRRLRTADGLTMLIGQAAAAFEKFFGQPAPREDDAELRALLIA